MKSAIRPGKDVEVQEMIYFFKPLPPCDEDMSEYQPFIRNEWFRKHFMKFVYALQAVLALISVMLGVWDFANLFVKIVIFSLVYMLHELLHVLVVYKIGDISLTHSGIFLWLNSSAVMSKRRFWLFMTLPLIVLTVIPMILVPVADGMSVDVLRYILWINAIIAGSDMINSVLIAIKPQNARFYRGYYTTKDS